MGQHVYRTLRLLDTNKNGSKRTGVLAHRGYNYSFTDGCILAMYSELCNDILNKPEDYIREVNLGYNIELENLSLEGSTVFMQVLYDKIKEIKDANGGEINGIIRIIEEDGDNSLDVALDKIILRNKANVYYRDLKIGNWAKGETEVLSKKNIRTYINSNTDLLTEFEKEVKGIIDNSMTKEKRKNKMVSVWNDLLSKSKGLDSKSIISSLDKEQLRKEFEDNLNEKFNLQLKTMDEDDIGNVLRKLADKINQTSTNEVEKWIVDNLDDVVEEIKQLQLDKLLLSE